jgi:hypothetical protein
MVEIGRIYVIRDQNLLIPVRIDCKARDGQGWWAVNLITNDRVLVRHEQLKQQVNPADPPDLVVRLSDDGQWHWFSAKGVDMAVYADTLTEAWRYAQLAWHRWNILPTGPFTAVLLWKP